jgi:hypothetical protein
VIENRFYERENTSPAEADEIRALVTLIEPGLLKYRETPKVTAYSIQLLAEAAVRISAGLQSYAMVIDLRDAELPSAKARKALRESLFSDPRLSYVAVFTGKNSVINVVAKLVLSQSMGGLRFSVSQHEQQALEKAREGLKSSATLSA